MTTAEEGFGPSGFRLRQEEEGQQPRHDSPLPSEPEARSLKPEASPPPAEFCDVCEEPLGSEDYVQLVVLRKPVMRRPSGSAASGALIVIDEQWRLDAVCAGCNQAFEDWLYGARRDQLPTLPAPAMDGAEAACAPSEAELDLACALLGGVP